MGKAFNCDRCDEFREGSPQRIKALGYRSVTFMGWTDAEEIHKLELCFDCSEELKTMLNEWLGEDDD